MLTWVAIRAFFSGILGKISVPHLLVGGLIVAVIAAFYFQHSHITKLETQLIECSAAKVKLEDAIEVQNKSIEESERKRKALQDTIDLAVEDNKKLGQENKKLKDKLTSIPIPEKCVDQVSELRSTMKDFAKKWNKQ